MAILSVTIYMKRRYMWWLCFGRGRCRVGFLAFDEVFGSQDEERRYEIMEALHTIKKQYRQQGTGEGTRGNVGIL